MSTQGKHVLVLGGNFAGLGAAQKIRDHAGKDVGIAVVDRKAYADCVPNILLEMFEDLSRMPSREADTPFAPIVARTGDMDGGKAFYIRADAWCGALTRELRIGRLPYLRKAVYSEVFFRNGARTPEWGLRPTAQWMPEHWSK